ncbi:uncharacterized protein B0I36DRAFT_363709 [Microdochium trichocladiopsis]|uniref:ubiquitinyl hydrolase 1 n=1 Tax=Microdochium trichocladiopsis TaxID=1682393 RepID=A0A9P9BM02_9PEZI|nr:uncharacterized protein B0I36DRAFT_363709 [Microdochium trichocladiopsis]KAH7029123.1 hypothetical protein B0I36DRAFT_363709 [Microdochium trichocladiopsis]
MGSEADEPAFAGVERLNAMKVKAEASFRAGQTRAYTSPKALQSFLNQQLPELFTRQPCDHELQLIGTQTYEDSHANFVSTVCGLCRHHFHFSSNGPSSLVRRLGQDHPQHMLLAYEQQSPNDFAEDRSRNKHDYTYAAARFICCDQDCHFSIEIRASSPRITDRDVDLFQDVGRVRENLARAREDDPDRYADVEADYGTQAASTMLVYLSDHLARKPDAGPLKIKKRNKRFMVSFSTDFDPLLRSLGWEEREDPEGEACWFLPQPTPPHEPTLTRTLQAHYEDARAELILLFTTTRPTPAWEQVLRVLQGHYDPYRSAPSLLNQIEEDDLDLLGCLRDYGPTVFSWAAILLANIDPRRRQNFTQAALRCIKDRSEIARDAIVIFDSSYDAGSTNASFEYFATTPSARNDAQYFIDQYKTIIGQNPTDDEKAKALQHLQIIEGETKLQIISQMEPDMLMFEGSAFPNNTSGVYSVKAAEQLLGIEAAWPADLIRGFVHNLDETKSRSEVARALDSLANHKRGLGELNDAEELQQMASFLQGSETGHLQAKQAATPKHESTGSNSLSEPAKSMDIPPGIYNIGNTCYLNSLLQYFYNVVPIRRLLKNFDDFKLELDAEHVNRRTTGGNALKFSLDEAIVARQFVETLQDLLERLETTTDKAVHGSQKLANTALLSAAELLAKQDAPPRQDTKPPPLPARPSPTPPATAGEDVDMVNVTVEPADGQTSANSPAGSSQTLVNEPEPMSAISSIEGAAEPTTTEPGGPPPLGSGHDVMDVDSNKDELPEALTLEERTARIAWKLDQSERRGTSQQDVGEIMGNILEHLVRSVRPTGTMPDLPDVQTDVITDLFFTTMVHHTVDLKKGSTTEKAIEEQRKEVMLDRWIQAFPHPEKGVSSSLYEALDRNLGFEVLDETRVRYSTIRSLPPILHICIQRTDNSGVKNVNPVVIPEILYLDRYMDANDDSDLDRTRRRMGVLQEYLRELEARSRKDSEFVIKPVENSSYFDPPPTQADLGDSFDPAGPPELDQDLLKDLAPVMSKRKSSPASTAAFKRRRSDGAEPSHDVVAYVEELHEDSVNLVEETNAKLREVRQEIQSAYADLKQHKYAIHAIICHLGDRQASGHYWVWIRDYKKNMWLSYNDANVTVDRRDSQELLDELNRGGEPYYIAYVRDADKEELVDVLHRTVPIDTTAIGSSTVDGLDGVARPHDALPEDAVMHIETIEGVDPTHVEDVSEVHMDRGFEDKKESSMTQVHEIHAADEPPPYEIV